MFRIHISITASNLQKTKKGYVYRKILLDNKNQGRPARVLWTMPSHRFSDHHIVSISVTQCRRDANHTE